MPMWQPATRDRVNLGALWLDEAEPGWWQRVVRPRLDMADHHNCLLGQVFLGADPHPYTYGLNLVMDHVRRQSPVGDVGLDPAHWAIQFGFEIDMCADSTSARLNYDFLGSAWSYRIHERILGRSGG